jgi:hypothetical protein
VSSEYHLHPEFGLLCPSRSFRRKARLALAFLAFLVIVGALSLKAGHDPDIDGAVMIAHGDDARSDAEAVQAVGPATDTATAETSRPLERSKAACERDPWSYIGGKCSVGGARKLRRARAANEAPTIAALPVGRSVPPAPASSAAPLDPTAAANPAVPTPAVTDPPGRPTPASKKVRKNRDHDLSRDRSRRDDRWSARAYALPDDRHRRGRYERSWGWSW